MNLTVFWISVKFECHFRVFDRCWRALGVDDVKFEYSDKTIRLIQKYMRFSFASNWKILIASIANVTGKSVPVMC